MGCWSIAGLPPSIKFAGTHLYTWVERGNVKVKCFPKNTTQCPRPGLEPGPRDPETSALTMRQPRLPQRPEGEYLPFPFLFSFFAEHFFQLQAIEIWPIRPTCFSMYVLNKIDKFTWHELCNQCVKSMKQRCDVITDFKLLFDTAFSD